MRCFLAIELPPATALALDAIGTAIRDEDPLWGREKWVRPDLMHVTLRFLGDIDSQLIQRISSEFAAAAAEQTPFALGFSGLRAVPSPGRASMIWAVAEDPAGRCASLASLADGIAVDHGLKSESRPFVPHLTLVRARHPHAVAPGTLQSAAMRGGITGWPEMSVLSATLFASTLTPLGPIHERLAQFALMTG